MVEATIITFRRTETLTAGGDLQEAVQPVVTGPFVSGQLVLDAIPISEFSRDRAIEAVQTRVQQLVPEDADVTVSIAAGA